jgi:hypothetical protein
MDLAEDIADLLTSDHGGTTGPAAERVGVSPDRLERLVAHGRLTRVRRGAYGASVRLAPWVAYAREVRAALLVSHEDSWATRWSGVVAHELPHLGSPPALVHLVRDKAPGVRPARHGRTRTLVATLPVASRTVSAGMRTCVAQRVALDLARHASFAEALVVADAVLHRGLVTPADFAAEAERHAPWPGGRRAGRVARHADLGAENPLETLGRLACIEFDLPVPLSNVWVGDAHPEHRVDHLWPDHWLVGEGDGLDKYDDRGVIEAEKERQWRLEQLGLTVVRYGWRLAYSRRPVLAARFAERLQRPGIPLDPCRWWPTDAR